MDEMTHDEIRKVLHGRFAVHAKEEGLSLLGEHTKGGFLFYDGETRTAFRHFILGYMAGRDGK